MTSSRLPPTIGSADQAGNSWLLGEAISIDEVTTRVLLRYRALTLAKDHLAALPTIPAGTKALPLADITGGKDWTDTPTEISSRRRILPTRTRPRPLSLRQHLRTLPELPHRRHLPAHPRRPTHRRPQTPDDAQRRGWITEAERRHQLIARLDATITDIQKSAG